ncbi:MAG: roadblock/LC7 domain-containing protein [Verrucomicrobiota bacterium]
MDFRHLQPTWNLHLGALLTPQLRQSLEEFRKDSEVRYAAILEESGTVCADAGDASLRDSGETAALAVGAFAALQAVAARLGDDSFEGFFHEGKTRQFCLMPITPQFLLLSVFQAPVRFAVVKICAQKAISRLQSLLESLSSPDLNFPPPPQNSRAPGTRENFVLSPDGFFPQD